jgi:2-oxo-4-hydroxy-4-carboxy-5-ureidoimidazoline decarboxylase
MAALRERFAATEAWSAGEQKSVAAASEVTLRRLRDGNLAYERRYGHIFIVCATGKSADEMLSLLESRMNHEPDEELAIAAGEQMKITEIRLDKLGAER